MHFAFRTRFSFRLITFNPSFVAGALTAASVPGADGVKVFNFGSSATSSPLFYSPFSWDGDGCSVFNGSVVSGSGGKLRIVEFFVARSDERFDTGARLMDRKFDFLKFRCVSNIGSISANGSRDGR